MSSIWHKDSAGNEYTTADGKPAGSYGTPVTIANGTGQLNNGRWNGTTAERTSDNGGKSSS
jgi:hypothetical protein